MEQEQDIGLLLQKQRQAQGFNLKDVAHKTRIPLSILAALEKNDYTVFSSMTYAKSFLSQYADFLTIDAYDWLSQFTIDASPNLPEYLERSEDFVTRKQHEKRRAYIHSILQTFIVLSLSLACLVGGVYAYYYYEPLLNKDINSTAKKIPKTLSKKQKSSPTLPVTLQTAPKDSNQVPAHQLIPSPSPLSAPSSSPRPKTPPKAIIVEE